MVADVGIKLVKTLELKGKKDEVSRDIAALKSALRV